MSRTSVIREMARSWPRVMTELPAEEVSEAIARIGGTMLAEPLRAWRSRHHIAILFHENGEGDSGAMRLSVMRTVPRADGLQADGILWDDLQRIKFECGFGERWMVEVFPPSIEKVNVANMRHLWLLGGAPEYGWHRSNNAAR